MGLTRQFLQTFKWTYSSSTLSIESLVRPHLEHVYVVWGSTFITDLNILESVQRKATRYVQNISNLLIITDSYIWIFQSYSFPIVHIERTWLYIYTYIYIRMTYNILHNNINLDLNDFFQLCSSSITHGQYYKLFNVSLKLWDWSEVIPFLLES